MGRDGEAGEHPDAVGMRVTGHKEQTVYNGYERNMVGDNLRDRRSKGTRRKDGRDATRRTRRRDADDATDASGGSACHRHAPESCRGASPPTSRSTCAHSGRYAT